MKLNLFHIISPNPIFDNWKEHHYFKPEKFIKKIKNKILAFIFL
jgi:hypothetical protein